MADIVRIGFLNCYLSFGGDLFLKLKNLPEGGPNIPFVIADLMDSGISTLKKQVAWRSKGQIPHAIFMIILNIFQQNFFNKSSFFVILFQRSGSDPALIPSYQIKPQPFSSIEHAKDIPANSLQLV